MDFASRLREIEDRMGEACHRAGRSRDEVTLVAVSKSFPLQSLEEAYQAGVRVFGESRLQEAEPKIAAMPADVEWHFIGNLQSNKAKRIATLFPTIHTVSNERQVREIEKAGNPIRAFVEVNVAREPQKAGIFSEVLDDTVEMILQYKCTQFNGLMTIGPAEASEAETRAIFSELRRLNERVGGTSLSMGMSGDFELAIQEGSTHVRIGSLLFGSRA